MHPSREEFAQEDISQETDVPTLIDGSLGKIRANRPRFLGRSRPRFGEERPGLRSVAFRCGREPACRPITAYFGFKRRRIFHIRPIFASVGSVFETSPSTPNCPRPKKKPGFESRGLDSIPLVRLNYREVTDRSHDVGLRSKSVWGVRERSQRGSPNPLMRRPMAMRGSVTGLRRPGSWALSCPAPGLF